MIDRNRKTGPNVKRLIIHKMSVDAIPPNGRLMDGVNFLRDPNKISDGLRNAAEWVFAAIDAVKQSLGGSEFGDDEAIVGEILRQVGERKKK